MLIFCETHKLFVTLPLQTVNIIDIPTMNRILLPFLSFLLSTCILPAQGIWDLNVPAKTKTLEIPFEYENNFIIIDLVFNGAFPLKFIFDTGAEHTILTKREITDLLAVPYEKRFTIHGADLTTELYAYLARGIDLKMSNIEFTNRSILVLEEDYFQFDQATGANIQGIIGADLFRRFIVQINYQTQKITLHNPAYFEPPKKYYIEHPLEMKRHKPYVYVCTHFQNDTIVHTKLLLDTGASLALLLYTDTHPNLRLPPQVIPSNIGVGLGGFLKGFLGRVNRVDVAGFPFGAVVTNFQNIYETVVDTSYLNNRNGIIGNQLLSRFDLIIDYIHEKLYLQPLPDYDEEFKYDRSGMLLAASGPRLNDFIVYDVIPGSPAYRAQIRPGDVIKGINGLPSAFFTLEDITRKLKGRVGKRIKLRLDRNGKTVKVKFRLREII